MAAAYAWILANYMTVLVDALALDRALMLIFPKASILNTIGNFLSNLVPKSS